MPWFFKVTYSDSTPTTEAWFGPFASEEIASAERDAQVAQTARIKRTDVYSPVEEREEQFMPSPAVMVTSGPNEDGETVEWEVHADGTRTPR